MLIEVIADPSNAKENCNSHFKGKKHKTSKTIKNNYSVTKFYRKFEYC